MCSRVRARWGVAALGCTGLLCAVLGAVMIVTLPSIVKQQVYKVGEGRRQGSGGRWAPRGPESLSAGERIGRGSGPPPRTLPDPGGGWGPRGHLGSLLEARAGEA